MNAETVKEKLKEALAVNDTAFDGKLYLDGKEYAMDNFRIQFSQSFDFKGEPQREVKGGLMTMTFRQVTDPALNYWMFHNNVKKNGRIAFHPDSRISSPILVIDFTGGRCTQYIKDVASTLNLTIIITADEINVNGITHRNKPIYD